jgi:hypothetical protein
VGVLVAGAIALALAVMLLTRRMDAERAAAAPAASPSASPAVSKPVQPSPSARPSPRPTPTPTPMPGATPADPLEIPPAPVAPAPAPTPLPRLTARPTPAPAEADEPTPEPDPEPEEPEPTPTPTPTPPPGDINGRWELRNDVESTSYEPFAGMNLGYRLNLVQDGQRVHGRGQKISENGVMLLPSQRTPIEVEGRILGDQLVLHFTEIGSQRTSRGTMRWRFGPGSTLRGRFSSDAADSSGPSVARRLP